MFKPVFLIVVVPLTLTFADSFQQSWFDGPGVYGPVSNWLESFYQSESIAWCARDNVENYFPIITLSNYLMIPVETGFENATFLTTSDIDGDGDTDIAASSGVGDGIAWWENMDGTGTNWAEHSVDENFSGAFNVTCEDIDGDGNMDIICAARWGDEIAWWRNDNGGGTAWSKHVIIAGFDGASSLNIVDMDNDGDLDVAGAALFSGEIIWLENTDSAGIVWTEHLIAADLQSPYSISSGDFDGDGDFDILAKANGDVLLWLNSDGSGTSWSVHTVWGTIPGIQELCATDVDGDGDLDVVGVKETGYSRINWWENQNGSGTSWSWHNIESYSSGAISVEAVDVDADGDMDIIGTSSSDGMVKYWLNLNGSGTNWHRMYVQGDFPAARDVCADDMDNDGDVDILAVSQSTGTIAWWQDTVYPESGWLESSIDITSPENVYYSLLTAWHETPPGTSVMFQLRASDDPDNMGPWSDTLAAPCSLDSVLDQGTAYLQYRAILTTDNPLVAPSLVNVSVYWNITGFEEDPALVEYHLLGPVVNPASGSAAINFHVPCISDVSFSVFDAAGRVIQNIPEKEYPEGLHQIALNELLPGIYLCRIQVAYFTDSCTFVVLQ